jgi:hypothetical protein
MIEYRKHKSGRQFYKVEGDSIAMRVINKSASSNIDIRENKDIVSEILLEVETQSCTEQEFKEALQVALDRINQFKI